MSSTSAVKSELTHVRVQTLYQSILSSSSSEIPKEGQLSPESTIDTLSPKMILFKSGLYEPGSGNICTKYIPMSDSELLRHPYYNYPGIKNPGILKALFEPEDIKIYPLDGQELYLDLCEKMNVIPVSKFHRGMLADVIDLKYYGVNPDGVRPMCLALTHNRYVSRLDLSSNFLSVDGCYHLGVLLGESLALRELVLSACGIQFNGMRRLTAFFMKRVMDLLDLSKNNMGDQGFLCLADRLKQGTVIKKLNLSRNSLGMDSAVALAEAVEVNNTFTNLDLSWNEMSPPAGINQLLNQLSNSTVLVELNLAWNDLTIGTALRRLLVVPTLRILNLSHNKLSTPAAKAIVLKLAAARRLDTLDLSFNQLSPADALLILNKMASKDVTLQNLLMDNISVNKEFKQKLNEIVMLDYKKNLNVTHGKVLRDYVLANPDMREIVLKRMDFLTSRASKKCHLDTALYFMEKYKQRELMEPRQVLRDMRNAKAPVDEDLVGGLANTFPGPRTDKGGMTIKLAGVVEMIHRLWPDKKLPPTPPEPEPEVIIVKEKKNKKNKKKV